MPLQIPPMENPNFCIMDEKKKLKDTSTIYTPVDNEVLGGTVHAGIIGGSGYTGGELIRILLNHPHAEISFAFSKSNAGKYLHEVHGDLIGETNLQFSNSVVSLFQEKDTLLSTNILFLCLGHGEAQKFLEENYISDKIKIIDLSRDFRLNRQPSIGNRKFVYGLPELNREKIRSAEYVANPGCFASAIQLGLLPLAKAGLLKEVYSTGITGSTGAGQSLTATSHFSWRANNIQAYKTLTHQHLNEIYQSLNQLQPAFPESPSMTGSNGAGNPAAVRFVPWRGDFTRGIFVSSQSTCDISEKGLNDLYEEFYNDHPFTFLSKEPISLKQVVNTNKCVIQIEKAGNQVVIHSALDNLLKGASGQAVQNMNVMFGLNETTGLKFKATYF